MFNQPDKELDQVQSQNLPEKDQVTLVYHYGALYTIQDMSNGVQTLDLVKEGSTLDFVKFKQIRMK